MSRTQAFLGWLEDRSDWLSPILVKEVRQLGRGREFNYAFAASLVAGLAVAFFGAADALAGTGTAGRWTFFALMACLALLGLAVVPLGAFSALRNERLEQTLELITLTALSPRRIMAGKLAAQGVKLATLFAAMAPFIAMSFLLGGIDFVTILVSLALLFMWSLWASALCLFLSTLLKSRAVSGLVFGAAGIALFLIFVATRNVFFVATRVGGAAVLPMGAGSEPWWALAMVTTFCLATMINLVLLGENRLSLPTENRVTTLRVGFLAQLLLVAGWTASFIHAAPAARSNAVEALGVFAGLHLALVAMFTVTEDLDAPRRVLLRMRSSSRRWLFAMFMPGGGSGAVYVLVQMALVLLTAWLLEPTPTQVRWLLAMFGYICFFTGVPAVIFQIVRPARAGSLHLRIAVLLLLPASMLLPDLIHYVLWRPEVLNMSFAPRHLVNPFRTLGNWRLVEAQGWLQAPAVFGVAGLFAYSALIQLGRAAVQSARNDPQQAAVAGEPGADTSY